MNLGDGRLARLNLEKTSANTSVPSVQLGSVSGAFGHLLSIPGKAVYAERASLAGNAHGELLFAWISADSHGGHREAWASVRPHGGRFGRPRLISASGGAAQVNAAVGSQGDMAIAFPDTHGNMVAAVRRHGQRWTPARSVGAAAGGSENDVTPFVAEDGQVVIAWYETQLCEGGCQNPGYVRVAVLPAGRSKFRPEQILEKDEIGLEAAPIEASLAPSVTQIRGRSPMIIFLARGPTRRRRPVSRRHSSRSRSPEATPLRPPRPYPKPGRRPPACGQPPAAKEHSSPGSGRNPPTTTTVP